MKILSPTTLVCDVIFTQDEQQAEAEQQAAASFRRRSHNIIGRETSSFGAGVSCVSFRIERLQVRVTRRRARLFSKREVEARLSRVLALYILYIYIGIKLVIRFMSAADTF